MESNQQPTKAKAGVTGVFNLVPAGVLQRKRKYIAARFPFGPPSFSQAEFVLGVDPQNALPSKQRDSAQAAAAPPPALLLASKAQQTATGSGGGSSKEVQLQGVPRTDAGNNYFVLMKAGRDFCVYPLDASYTFKQLVRPSAMTIEDVEAAQRAPAAAAMAAAAAESKMLLPKSMRQAMREEAAAEAADRQLKEDANTLPLLKDKVAELAAKYEGSSKLVLHADDDDDDEASDDDMGDLEDEEAGQARRRGRAKAKKEAAAAGKGKGKGKKGTPAAPDIPEDELAEDIYAGEEDELRPAAPGEAVDWEFDEAPADDDLEMGGSDEEGLDDDPGYRKQLGLEGDEEEEEEKAKREAELAADAAGEPAVAAGLAEGAAADGAAAVEGEGEDGDAGDMDEDDDFDVADEEEFDADALDRLAAESENALVNPALKRRKQSAVAAAARDRSPAPALAMRGATPPLAAAAAAATNRGSTPLGAAAAKRAAPPPSASTVAAAGRGAGRTPPPQGGSAAGQRLTPPPQPGNGVKRKRDAAGEGSSAGAGASSGSQGLEQQAAWNWTVDQLDGQGVPTTDGIIAALSAMGPIPTERLQLLQDRLNLVAIGNDGKTLLKKRLLQVAKVGVIDGKKYMVLK